jgi:hypothetical protein
MTPTSERTSTLCAALENPWSGHIEVVGVEGNIRKGKLPELSVFADRVNPLTGLCKVTDAPGITAPEGSVTVPCTLPELPVWA